MEKFAVPVVVSPSVLVSVSNTVPSGLRNVSRKGVFATSTRNAELLTIIGLPSITRIGGRGQFFTTVNEALVENGTLLVDNRTRATPASGNSSFTIANWQVNVSSLSELLNHESTLPGSARAAVVSASNTAMSSRFM